jgi:hypothetical protein
LARLEAVGRERYMHYRKLCPLRRARPGSPTAPRSSG